MANDSVGAIWKRTAKKSGQEYLAIVFTHSDGSKSEFIAFVNEKDGNEKRPDYKIFRSQPRDGNSPTGPQGSPTPRPSAPQAPRTQPAYASASTDPIPF